MIIPDDQIRKVLSPLKVFLLTEKPETHSSLARAAIQRAFQGGQASADANEAYFPVGEDLGVTVLETVFEGDGANVKNLLRAARQESLHILVIVFISQPPNSDFKAYLDNLDGEIAGQPADTAALALLIIWATDTDPSIMKNPEELLIYAKLGETALRPAYAAIHVLAHACRQMGRGNEMLKLFISHAKLDGLPLAKSVKHQLKEFPGMHKFYDAEDIPAGSDWREILRHGVETSVLTAVRTNVYEERFWCVQELDWAEDYGCPIVMVEARTRLERAREILPVAGSPGVSAADGDLTRILFSALREALRVRLFFRQIEALNLPTESVLAVPRTSIATLGMRCEDSIKNGMKVNYVFIPEPFREAHRPVAERLVNAYFPGAWLGAAQNWIDTQLANRTGGV